MILIKTISREYYRQNIGFYLFILLFAFGFLSGNEHVTLAKLFMANGIMFFWAFLTWLLHVLKTTLFFHRTLKLPEYQLFQDFNLLPWVKQLFHLLILQANLNLPFLAYSSFMIVIGIQEQKVAGIALVVLANLLLLALPVFLSFLRLRHFNREIEFFSWIPDFKLFPNWSSLYFVRHLLKNQPILFFSTKLYGLFFLIGGAKLYFTDEYDERLLFICTLLGAAGQFVLGREHKNFMTSKMLFERNFPLKIADVLISKTLISLSLIILDIIFMIYYWKAKVDTFALIGSLLFLLSVMLFWLVFQLSFYSSYDKYMKRIYFGGLLVFVLVMFKIPLILLAAFISIVSWRILRSNYYTFEHISADD